MGKRAHLYPRVSLADCVYVGQASTLGDRVEAQDGAVIHRHNRIGSDTNIGVEAMSGLSVSIGNRVEIQEGVRIGHHSRIYDRVRLIEGATVMPYSVINERAVIGAFAHVGEGSEVVSMGWVEAGKTVEGPAGKASLPMGLILDAIDYAYSAEGLEETAWLAELDELNKWAAS